MWGSPSGKEYMQEASPGQSSGDRGMPHMALEESHTSHLPWSWRKAYVPGVPQAQASK